MDYKSLCTKYLIPKRPVHDIDIERHATITFTYRLYIIIFKINNAYVSSYIE